MKLSIRGKSVRRGRHTKRAGKNLRYKGKKVRGSKRYNRGRGGGRVRTYKRGRRFQRGGCNPSIFPSTKLIQVGGVVNTTEIVIADNNIEFYPTGYCNSSDSISYGEKTFLVQKNTYESGHNVFDKLNSGAYVIAFNEVPLVFTKKGLFTGTKTPGNFKVVIIEHKPSADKPIRNFRAILTRQDRNIGTSSEVRFSYLGEESLDRFKAMLVNSTILDDLKSNHDNSYKFSYPNNLPFFELFIRAADVLSKYVETQFNKELEEKQARIQEGLDLIKEDEEFATIRIQTLFDKNKTDIEKLRNFFKALESGKMNEGAMNAFKNSTGIQIKSIFNIAVKNALDDCKDDIRRQRIIRDKMIDKFYDELRRDAYTDRETKITDLKDPKYIKLAEKINTMIKKLEMRILYTVIDIESGNMPFHNNPIGNYDLMFCSELISYFDPLCNPTTSEETYNLIISKNSSLR